MPISQRDSQELGSAFIGTREMFKHCKKKKSVPVLWSVLWKDKLDCAFELMCLVWIASYYTQWASNPITATKSNCSHAKTCPHSLCGELVSGKGTTEVSEQAERPGFHFHSCNPQGWHANLSPVSSPGHRLDGQSWVGVMPWEKWRGRACCTAFNCVLAWIVPSQIHIHLETWMWWVKLKWSHTGFMCVHLCMFSCSVMSSSLQPYSL